MFTLINKRNLNSVGQFKKTILVQKKKNCNYVSFLPKPSKLINPKKTKDTDCTFVYICTSQYALKSKKEKAMLPSSWKCRYSNPFQLITPFLFTRPTFIEKIIINPFKYGRFYVESDSLVPLWIIVVVIATVFLIASVQPVVLCKKKEKEKNKKDNNVMAHALLVPHFM